MQARAIWHCSYSGLPTLVRKHVAQSGLVGGVRDNGLAQLSFAGARLRGQDVTGERMLANNLAGSRLLEPLGRTFVCLQFRHKMSWEFPTGVAVEGDINESLP
jgi:hypothetical protein